ncbi:MAG: 4-(cytidine 5'-diphospho)-2-C-methyl-D-erythritol kinase [Clostridia bacterium]|nr:4-(cytidine 5'-diphospho)-2-C-methyl-D-erythritol kinase [Clostridia bacterium]
MLCLKAHAKINWTLDILGTREDGYHLMDMLMQSVEMHDVLYLEEADELTLEGATVSGRIGDGSGELSSAVVTYDEKNLVYRAAKKLKERYQVEKGARMRLEKHIPSGAGMGGGSADAAAALKGLCQLWNLNVPEAELLALGLSLGADIPFMLTGGLARVGGIGENIQPLSPVPQIWLVMLQPCEGLSTKEVFTAFDSLDPDELVRPRTIQAQQALIARDLPLLASSMDNVLEGVSVKVRPAISEACRVLEAAGAVRGMMTGSGSVVYGVFDNQAQAEAAAGMLRPIAQKENWGDVWVTHTLGSEA